VNHRNALLTALALSLAPGLALADAKPRQGPTDARCQRGPDKKSEKIIAKFGAGLGGADTRKSWKKLMDAGSEGCQMVADWLAEGGAGEELAGTRDVAERLIMWGDDSQFVLGTTFLMGHDDDTTMQIVEGLEKRLAALTPEQTDFLANHANKAVRDKALGLLMGYHSEGKMVMKKYGPVTVMEYEETLWLGAGDGPSEHHLAAVAAILAAGDHDTAERVAKYGSRFYKERYSNNDAWAALMLPFVSVAKGDDAQKAANIVARNTAWGEGAGLAELVTAAAASGNQETLEHLLDGFENGIKAGFATQATLGFLEQVAAGEGKQAKRAATMAKKAAKKIK